MSTRIRLSILLLAAFVPTFGAKVPGRYIVEMNTEPVAEHMARRNLRAGLRGSIATTHRERIHTEQQTLRQRLATRKATVLDSVDTVANALFVEVSDSEAAQLASLPGVKRVVPVRTFHLVLDRALLMHKVQDAWATIGEDKAGQGVKIAIIDTGIDPKHAGFQDSSLTVPDGYPKAANQTALTYTSNKVIVARSYVSLLPSRDPDTTPADRVGHGTALAMVSAGVRNAGPLATITGVAPKAFLGNYKVFGTPGYNDSSSDDAILKAIDDAVADGMDIINLSLGTDFAPRLEDDLEVQAIERATQAGVIVVTAAGNDGPDLNTMSSPGTAPSAIAVGAVTNDRKFARSVEVPGLNPFTAIAGSGTLPSSPVIAQGADVSKLDSNGLACNALPANSLTGKIAIILRGTCTFESKLINARNAGAVGAVVYAAESSPEPISMAVGTATLPAMMVSFSDGTTLKDYIASQPAMPVTMHFTVTAVPSAGRIVSSFSAAGPNVNNSIKPDMTAIGTDVYTATQSLDPNGDMYSSNGYIAVSGTSFSSPLVAGAAALLKAARPGLTVDQYRSLLINTSTAASPFTSGVMPSVQQTGAGIMDVNAALQSTIAAYPTSVSFGAGGLTANSTQTLHITNLSGTAASFSLGVEPSRGALTPTLQTTSVDLEPGASADIPVVWNISGATAGDYEGILTVSSSNGSAIRVPYWYAAVDGTPAHITILDSTTSGRRNGLLRDVVLFRITDTSGVNLLGTPTVTVIEGNGIVRNVSNYDSDIPGLMGLTVQLGPVAGRNVFRIEAGSVSYDLVVTGQ